MMLEDVQDDAILVKRLFEDAWSTLRVPDMENLKDGVIIDIIGHVGIWSGRYPASLVNILQDLAENYKVFLENG